MTDDLQGSIQPLPLGEPPLSPDQEIVSLGKIMNDTSLPLDQRQAAQAEQLAVFRSQGDLPPQAAPSSLSPQEARLAHERGQIAGLAAIINDFTKPAMERQRALERQYELLQHQHAYQWSTQRIDPHVPQTQTQLRPQTEDPGAKQAAQEAQWLAECYDRAMRGRLPSEQQHRDNHEWIKVLVERQHERQRTGRQLLEPLTGWPGTETPDHSPGQTSQASGAAGDAGARQLAEEEAAYQEALKRGMSGRYRTSAEWRDLHYRLHVHHERMEWRRKTGKQFIPDHLCRPRPTEETRANGPRW
jgi:hypothetical protein